MKSLFGRLKVQGSKQKSHGTKLAAPLIKLRKNTYVGNEGTAFRVGRNTQRAHEAPCNVSDAQELAVAA